MRGQSRQFVRHDSRIRFAETILRCGHRSARRVTRGSRPGASLVHREVGPKVVVSRYHPRMTRLVRALHPRYRTVNRVSVLHLPRPRTVSNLDVASSSDQ